MTAGSRRLGRPPRVSEAACSAHQERARSSRCGPWMRGSTVLAACSQTRARPRPTSRALNGLMKRCCSRISGSLTMYNGRRERSASSTFWISWTLSSMSSGWLKRQPHFVASAPRISADCDARPACRPCVPGVLPWRCSHFPSATAITGISTAARPRPGLIWLCIAGDRESSPLHSRRLHNCHKPDAKMTARYAKPNDRGRHLCKPRQTGTGSAKSHRCCSIVNRSGILSGLPSGYWLCRQLLVSLQNWAYG